MNHCVILIKTDFGWCNMRILVLSDSHSALRFMRSAIDAVKPDAVIHLGDHYDDGTAVAEEFEHIPFHQVVGNCDRFRCNTFAPDQLCYNIGGVRLLMTHGHLHGVKSGTERLLLCAREQNAQGVLYGHTHCPDCRQEGGLWVLNPGSCGSSGGSVGLMEIEDGKIIACRILRQADLEAFT